MLSDDLNEQGIGLGQSISLVIPFCVQIKKSLFIFLQLKIYVLLLHVQAT